jgi:hypothetical protein
VRLRIDVNKEIGGFMSQGRVFPGLETFAVLRDSITKKGLRSSLGVIGTIETP